MAVRRHGATGRKRGADARAPGGVPPSGQAPVARRFRSGLPDAHRRAAVARGRSAGTGALWQKRAPLALAASGFMFHDNA